MRYLEVRIRCERAAADAVGNILAELTGGGYAVDDPLDILENQRRGAWDYTDLTGGDPAWVHVAAWLPEAGALEEQRLTLDRRLGDLRALGLGQIGLPALRWVQEEDWANAWKAYFKPFRVGRRLVVIPSWETYNLMPDDLPIHLDPGMAFGTGTHATTALCLAWLQDLVRPGARVIDAGTGSGILSVAAAKLGAGAVLAFDPDPVAVRVAAENLERNGAAAQVRVFAGLIQAPEVADWCSGGAPDLVVANIIASIIEAISPDVERMLPEGGLFLASGIIREKQEGVLAAMSRAGLSPREIREEGGWVAILARK